MEEEWNLVREFVTNTIINNKNIKRKKLEIS